MRVFRPGERVAIVTSDITRYTGSEIYLPLLVEELSAPVRERISRSGRAGIHRKQTEHDTPKLPAPLRTD